MTIKNYSTFSDWKGVGNENFRSGLHFVNCDFGPRGDVTSGKVSIHGDRWKHGRIGYLCSPGSTLLQNIDAASIEAPTADALAGQPDISIASTKGFSRDDEVDIEDSEKYEVKVIAGIADNSAIILNGNLENTFYTAKNFLVSTLPEIHIERNEALTVGDYIGFMGKDDEKPFICKIFEVDNETYSEKTILKVIRLGRSFKKDDHFYIVNTDLRWTRDERNPIIGLQNNSDWDWAGHDVGRAEFLQNVDIETGKDDKELWKKPGLWITGGFGEGIKSDRIAAIKR